MIGLGLTLNARRAWGGGPGFTVTQLAYGAVSGATSFSTASVNAGASRLLVLDMLVSPDSMPVAFSPTVGGLGGTWVRQDPAGDLYATTQRWRCELGAGSTDTVDVSWAASATVLYSLMEITGHAPGSNGANAFVQTVKAQDNSVTLSAFTDPGNQTLASWGAFYAPDPGGSVDAPLSAVGDAATIDTGAVWTFISGTGPEDLSASITWIGVFVERAIASEIAVA